MAKVMHSKSVIKNDLLAKLPRKEFERLAGHLQLVELAKEQVLIPAGAPIKHTYFPEDSLISLSASTKQNQFFEIGAAGSNSIVGIPVMSHCRRMPFQAIVQFPGKAWRVKAEILRSEFERGDKLQNILLCYLQVLLIQLAQSAVCNRFHRIEERFSRWLLACHYEVKKDVLPLTHQAMALMLGVPRTLITMTARKLQTAGLIECQRGMITVLDKNGLAAVACDCHQIVHRESVRLLGGV